MIERAKIAIVAGMAAVLGLAVAVSGCLSLRRDPHELAVGAPAPAAPPGALLGVDGKPVDLAALAPGKLPVLAFYRGHW